jgi:hypothetical protein
LPFSLGCWPNSALKGIDPTYTRLFSSSFSFQASDPPLCHAPTRPCPLLRLWPCPHPSAPARVAHPLLWLAQRDLILIFSAHAAVPSSLSSGNRPASSSSSSPARAAGLRPHLLGAHNGNAFVLVLWQLASLVLILGSSTRGSPLSWALARAAVPSPSTRSSCPPPHPRCTCGVAPSSSFSAVPASSLSSSLRCAQRRPRPRLRPTSSSSSSGAPSPSSQASLILVCR